MNEANPCPGSTQAMSLSWKPAVMCGYHFECQLCSRPLGFKEGIPSLLHQFIHLTCLFEQKPLWKAAWHLSKHNGERKGEGRAGPGSHCPHRGGACGEASWSPREAVQMPPPSPHNVLNIPHLYQLSN